MLQKAKRKRGNGIVDTTLATYLLSSLKRIFHNGQPTHGGVCKTYEGIISTSPLGILDLKASLWASTLYLGNHDRKYQPLNIVSIGRCILRMQLKYFYFTIRSFCRKVLFSTDTLWP